MREIIKYTDISSIFGDCVCCVGLREDVRINNMHEICSVYAYYAKSLILSS